MRINLALDTDRAPGGVDYGMLKRIDELDRTFAELSAWRIRRSPSRSPTARYGSPRWPSSPATPSTCSACSRASAGCSRPRRCARAARQADGPSCSAMATGASASTPILGVVGKTIRLSDQPVTVVGVAPACVPRDWPGVEPAMYLPAPLHERGRQARRRSARRVGVGVSGLGRLKPGLSVADAQRRPRGPRAPPHRRVRAERAAPSSASACGCPSSPAQTGFPTMFRYEYSGPLYLMQGLVARGAAPVLRERQRPDALEAARASARVRGPHGDRRRLAAPRPPVPDRVAA